MSRRAFDHVGDGYGFRAKEIIIPRWRQIVCPTIAVANAPGTKFCEPTVCTDTAVTGTLVTGQVATATFSAAGNGYGSGRSLQSRSVMQTSSRRRY